MLNGVVHQNNSPGWVGFRWNVYSHVVNKVYKNTPAESLGIRVGDHVTKLEPFTGYDLEPVVIEVVRGDQVLKFYTYRDKIPKNK